MKRKDRCYKTSQVGTGPLTDPVFAQDISPFVALGDVTRAVVLNAANMRLNWHRGYSGQSVLGTGLQTHSRARNGATILSEKSS